MRLIKRLFIILSISLLVLTGLELGLKIFLLVRNKIAPQNRSAHKMLGWMNQSHVTLTYHHTNYGKIQYTLGDFGFRKFGDIHTEKTKILIIGDSFTEAGTVYDGYTFYEKMAELDPGIEIFAYGAQGYGSLQEYMILEIFTDMVQPDIILWQFCDNDIINNSYELESKSLIHNNHTVRPYLVDERIVWLFPSQNKGLWEKLLRNSKFFKILSVNWNLLKSKRVPSVESSLQHGDPLYEKALATTQRIMQKVKQRAGDTPIVAFSVKTYTGLPGFIEDDFTKMCLAEGILVMDSFPEVIEKAKQEGLKVDATPDDSHWNNLGHALVAEHILKFLKDKGLL